MFVSGKAKVLLMKYKGGGHGRLNDTDADFARVWFQMAENEYACVSVATSQHHFYFYTVISENNAYDDCHTPCTDWFYIYLHI